MAIDRIPSKAYLGDGVYADWDAGRRAIALTAENGLRATATIYLEADVIDAFELFCKRLREAIEAAEANGDEDDGA